MKCVEMNWMTVLVSQSTKCFLSRNCQKMTNVDIADFVVDVAVVVPVFFFFLQRSTGAFIHCYKFYSVFFTLLWLRSIIVHVKC